jgi:hypothetical protein
VIFYSGVSKIAERKYSVLNALLLLRALKGFKTEKEVSQIDQILGRILTLGCLDAVGYKAVYELFEPLNSIEVGEVVLCGIGKGLKE